MIHSQDYRYWNDPYIGKHNVKVGFVGAVVGTELVVIELLSGHYCSCDGDKQYVSLAVVHRDWIPSEPIDIGSVDNG